MAFPREIPKSHFFKLYALDAGVSNKQLLQAMEGHVLAQTEVMGVYSR